MDVLFGGSNKPECKEWPAGFVHASVWFSFYQKESMNYNVTDQEVHSVDIHSHIFCPFSFAMELLSKMSMTKIKSHGCPPALVHKVMQAIEILQGKEPTWVEAKSQLGERQQQDEGMNKGRKLKGAMQAGRAIWV